MARIIKPPSIPVEPAPMPVYKPKSPNEPKEIKIIFV